ncbi:hypothetical protein DRO55_04120 [Candidatus Bathyarchaeota archaeon]|nr:MAG: hypothetical protein DRO55_04120 [Candidatus Bathyarchaeota archaeon]
MYHQEGGPHNKTGKEVVYLLLLKQDSAGDNPGGPEELINYMTEPYSEYCFRMGALYLVPRPYMPLVEGNLRRIREGDGGRRRNLNFKFLRALVHWDEYMELQGMILEQIRSRLERLLRLCEGGKLSGGEISRIYESLMRVREVINILNLERLYPREVVELHDLIDIVGERLSKLRLCEVEVRVEEIEGDC